MIARSIITSFLTSLTSLMITGKDHIQHFLLTVYAGLAIFLIGSLIENNLSALSFSVFLILFWLYIFIRIYNSSEKKVKRY